MLGLTPGQLRPAAWFSHPVRNKIGLGQLGRRIPRSHFDVHGNLSVTPHFEMQTREKTLLERSRARGAQFVPKPLSENAEAMERRIDELSLLLLIKPFTAEEVDEIEALQEEIEAMNARLFHDQEKPLSNDPVPFVPGVSYPDSGARSANNFEATLSPP